MITSHNVTNSQTDASAFRSKLEAMPVGHLLDSIKTIDAEPQDAKNALLDALKERNADGLTRSQSRRLQLFAQALNEISAAEVTLQEARTILTRLKLTLNLQAVTDLQTASGRSLNGFASGSNIMVDDRLSGSDLQNTLIEELAESFHQTSMGGFSKGDFGAEVAARMRGEPVGKGDLNQYLSTDQTDTVQVFGQHGEILIGEAFDGALRTLRLGQLTHPRADFVTAVKGPANAHTPGALPVQYDQEGIFFNDEQWRFSKGKQFVDPRIEPTADHEVTVLDRPTYQRLHQFVRQGEAATDSLRSLRFTNYSEALGRPLEDVIYTARTDGWMLSKFPEVEFEGGERWVERTDALTGESRIYRSIDDAFAQEGHVGVREVDAIHFDTLEEFAKFRIWTPEEAVSYYFQQTLDYYAEVPPGARDPYLDRVRTRARFFEELEADMAEHYANPDFTLDRELVAKWEELAELGPDLALQFELGADFLSVSGRLYLRIEEIMEGVIKRRLELAAAERVAEEAAAAAGSEGGRSRRGSRSESSDTKADSTKTEDGSNPDTEYESLSDEELYESASEYFSAEEDLPEGGGGPAEGSGAREGGAAAEGSGAAEGAAATAGQDVRLGYVMTDHLAPTEHLAPRTHQFTGMTTEDAAALSEGISKTRGLNLTPEQLENVTQIIDETYAEILARKTSSVLYDASEKLQVTIGTTERGVLKGMGAAHPAGLLGNLAEAAAERELVFDVVEELVFGDVGLALIFSPPLFELTGFLFDKGLHAWRDVIGKHENSINHFFHEFMGFRPLSIPVRSLPLGITQLLIDNGSLKEGSRSFEVGSQISAKDIAKVLNDHDNAQFTFQLRADPYMHSRQISFVNLAFAFQNGSEYRTPEAGEKLAEVLLSLKGERAFTGHLMQTGQIDGGMMDFVEWYLGEPGTHPEFQKAFAARMTRSPKELEGFIERASEDTRQGGVVRPTGSTYVGGNMWAQIKDYLGELHDGYYSRHVQATPTGNHHARDY